jgi:hypothetical protein
LQPTSSLHHYWMSSLGHAVLIEIERAEELDGAPLNLD